jgi:hypothetical protein
VIHGIYRVTEVAKRISMSQPFDPREPRVRYEHEPEVPEHLYRIGAHPSQVAKAKQAARAERVTALEELFLSTPAGFARLYLKLTQDDPSLIHHLSPNAAAYARTL